MAVPGDYYKVLGVPRDADAETIKTAFRRLAHRYHPDVSTEPDAEQRFREIAEAYGVLSDPAKRASYDERGSDGVVESTAEDLWRGIDLTDIFGSRAPSFDALFERLFGPLTSTGPLPGDDVRLELTISLAEVMTGEDRVVTIRRPSPCPQCGGRGSVPGARTRRCQRCGGAGQWMVTGRQGRQLVRQVITCPECAGQGRVIDQRCPVCNATGWTTRDETVGIHIPPGIPEGATMKLTGQGMPSPVPGGAAGDAYVTIHTRSDPLFSRVGADLWHDLHIPVPDAALGVTTTVHLPGGHVRVRVPPGTQPGSVLRVAGKGLPSYEGADHGDLQLKVILEIPRQLSAPQRQLYEQLRAVNAGSTVNGSRDPEVARADQGIAANPGARHVPARGWLTFASVLLMLAAAGSLIAGITAIGGSHQLVTGARQVSDLSNWGWIMIIFGALQIVGAVVVWAGGPPWRRASHQQPSQPNGQ